MKVSKVFITWLVFCSLCAFPASAQTTDSFMVKGEILTKDSVRKYLGVYEFNPDFKMKVFSETADQLFAQRIGDPQKFQVFLKHANIFYLKAMPAELEFVKSANGNYEALFMRQEGKEMKATRIRYQPYELYDTIMRLDSEFYAAYNHRDLRRFMSYLSPGLEFYHDLTGLTGYRENLAIFSKKFSDTSLVMRRELVIESAEVHPIKNFGAIETGIQKFYVVDKAKGDRLASQPRFVHIWQNTKGSWKIVRVISYDH